MHKMCHALVAKIEGGQTKKKSKKNTVTQKLYIFFVKQNDDDVVEVSKVKSRAEQSVVL